MSALTELTDREILTLEGNLVASIVRIIDLGDEAHTTPDEHRAPPAQTFKIRLLALRGFQGERRLRGLANDQADRLLAEIDAEDV
jgi:hypothetical protein